MARTKTTWIALAALLGAGCASGGAARPTPAAADSSAASGEGAQQEVSAGDEASEAKKRREKLEALFRQELPEQAVHELSTPKGEVRARMEASSAPTVAVQDGFVSISAPLGEETIECFVYPESKDLAEVIRLMAEATLSQAAPEHGWIDVRADQSQGWPYLLARAHYLVETPQGKMVGDYKIASSVLGETSVVCVFDSPGKYRSFERVVRGLLASLDTEQNRALARPQRSTITRARMQGRMVTLSRREWRLEKRKRTITSSHSMLAIGVQGALSSSDRMRVETYRKGRLESANYAKATAGEFDYDLELAYRKGAYAVTGKLQEKPFEASFRVAGGLMDDLRSDAATCDVHHGKKPSVELLSYEPDADPMAPLPALVEKSPDPDAHLRVTVGKQQALQMSVTVDESCDIVKGAMMAGQVPIEIERLWIEKNDK